MLCALIAGALMFHEPIFLSTWQWLVVDEPARPTDYALVSTTMIDEPVALYRSGRVQRLLYALPRTTRTTQLGITPPAADEMKQLLAVRGVPADVVDFIPAREDRRSGWAFAAQLEEFLTANPGRTVTIVAERHQGRFLEYLLGRALTAPLRERITLEAAATSRFDENGWWTDRLAVQAVTQQYLLLAIAWWHGPDAEPYRAWSVDELEAAVARGERL